MLFAQIRFKRKFVRINVTQSVPFKCNVKTRCCFQANAPRGLRDQTRGRRLVLQRHASRCQHKLRLQLQEEVSLSVAPADLCPVLHPLHPIHFSEHLTVWLQVCHLVITLGCLQMCTRVFGVVVRSESMCVSRLFCTGIFLNPHLHSLSLGSDSYF